MTYEEKAVIAASTKSPEIIVNCGLSSFGFDLNKGDFSRCRLFHYKVNVGQVLVRIRRRPRLSDVHIWKAVIRSSRLRITAVQRSAESGHKRMSDVEALC
jgi:hypothetical protein